MTNLQQTYLINQETMRHNRETEAKDREANRLRADELGETKRANRSNESIKRDSNRITDRHNLVTEEQARAELTEKRRHNTHTEIAGYMSATGQLLRGGAQAATAVKSFIPVGGNTGRIGF